MPNHAIIDFETYSLAPNPHLICFSVRVFKYPSMEPKAGASMYGYFEPRENTRYDRHVDQAVVEWWQGRSMEFMKDWKSYTFFKFLVSLNSFLKVHDVVKLWSHGKDADCLWLSTLYKDVGVDPHEATQYQNTLDTRTLYTLADFNPYDFKRDWLRKQGMKEHNPQVDTLVEIAAMKEAYGKLLQQVL